MASRRRPLVKICGITNEADGRLALECGADLLGFIMAPSPRRVTARRAAELVRRLRKHPAAAKVAMTGVFMDARPGWLLKSARGAQLDVVQLHGEESPDYVARVIAAGFKVMKVVKTLDRAAITEMRRFSGAWAFLLEPRRAGPGRAKPRNPDCRPARAATRAHPRVGLAGGVSAENVRKVARDAGPGLWLVDSASGVELRPGRKDPDRLRRFFAELRGSR
jgi:phosphoribosylanthranilate isomerase